MFGERLDGINKRKKDVEIEEKKEYSQSKLQEQVQSEWASKVQKLQRISYCSFFSLSLSLFIAQQTNVWHICVLSVKPLGSRDYGVVSSYRHVYTYIHYYLKSCNALVKLGRCFLLKMGIVGRVCYLYIDLCIAPNLVRIFNRLGSALLKTCDLEDAFLF